MSEILTQSGAVLQSDFLDSFFQKGELIPAIVQESGSKEVLMLAYMNRESLQKTRKRVIPGFIVVPVKSFGIKVLHRDICKK